jgi:hypothetical protein
LAAWDSWNLFFAEYQIKNNYGGIPGGQHGNMANKHSCQFPVCFRQLFVGLRITFADRIIHSGTLREQCFS